MFVAHGEISRGNTGYYSRAFKSFKKMVQDGEIDTELQKINDRLNLWRCALDVDVSLQNVFWAATPSHISAITGTPEVNSPPCLCLNSNRKFTVPAADALATCLAFNPSNTRQNAFANCVFAYFQGNNI